MKSWQSRSAAGGRTCRDVQQLLVHGYLCGFRCVDDITCAREEGSQKRGVTHSLSSFARFYWGTRKFEGHSQPTCSGPFASKKDQEMRKRTHVTRTMSHLPTPSPAASSRSESKSIPSTRASLSHPQTALWRHSPPCFADARKCRRRDELAQEVLTRLASGAEDECSIRGFFHLLP